MANVMMGGGRVVDCELHLPHTAHRRPLGLAILAHGTGSGLHSPRNRFVARLLRERGFGTLLLDCRTDDGDLLPDTSGTDEAMRLALPMIARRIEAVGAWLLEQPDARGIPLGLLGSGLGGAAVLMYAAERPEIVRAIVTRGARSEYVADFLGRVNAPTLFVVGARDVPVVQASRRALDLLASPDKRLEIVPGAGHMFEEPGALSAAAFYAANWFARHLAGFDQALVAGTCQTDATTPQGSRVTKSAA